MAVCFVAQAVETLREWPMFFGEVVREGRVFVFVNSAQGNRSVGEAFLALGSAVSSDGAVLKALLLGRVQAVTDEAPRADETVFGAQAIRRRVTERLAVLTRHPYSDQGVNKILRGWDFVERSAGLDWSCVRSLDTAVASHVAARVEHWVANLKAANAC